MTKNVQEYHTKYLHNCMPCTDAAYSNGHANISVVGVACLNGNATTSIELIVDAECPKGNATTSIESLTGSICAIYW